MNEAIELGQDLTDYVLRSSEPLGPVAARIIAETGLLPQRSMQIPPDEAILLRAIVRMVKPRHILEIGTFTGLSALVMASALPEDGHITCLDISEEFTARARAAWEEAGLSNRINLIIGSALESLAHLTGPYDIVFIDADKGNYRNYVERVLPMVPSGGMLLIDNTLWDRKVIEDNDEPDTVAIREFNEWFAAHPEVDVDMLAMADGVTIGIKR